MYVDACGGFTKNVLSAIFALARQVCKKNISSLRNFAHAMKLALVIALFFCNIKQEGRVAERVRRWRRR